MSVPLGKVAADNHSPEYRDEVLAATIAEDIASLDSADLESLEAKQRMLLSERKFTAVIDQWQAQQESERPLRAKFAMGILIGLACQVAFIDVFAILIGTGRLEMDVALVELIIVAVFSKVALVGFAVVRYLFPRDGSALHGLLSKL